MHGNKAHTRNCTAITQTDPATHETEFFYSAQEVWINTEEQGQVRHRSGRYNKDFVPVALSFSNCLRHAFDSSRVSCDS